MLLTLDTPVTDDIDLSTLQTMWHDVHRILPMASALRGAWEAKAGKIWDVIINKTKQGVSLNKKPRRSPKPPAINRVTTSADIQHRFAITDIDDAKVDEDVPKRNESCLLQVRRNGVGSGGKINMYMDAFGCNMCFKGPDGTTFIYNIKDGHGDCGNDDGASMRMSEKERVVRADPRNSVYVASLRNLKTLDGEVTDIRVYGEVGLVPSGDMSFFLDTVPDMPLCPELAKVFSAAPAAGVYKRVGDNVDVHATMGDVMTDGRALLYFELEIPYAVSATFQEEFKHVKVRLNADNIAFQTIDGGQWTLRPIASTRGFGDGRLAWMGSIMSRDAVSVAVKGLYLWYNVPGDADFDTLKPLTAYEFVQRYAAMESQ